MLALSSAMAPEWPAPYTAALEMAMTRVVGDSSLTHSNNWAVVATVRKKSSLGQAIAAPTEDPPAR